MNLPWYQWIILAVFLLLLDCRVFYRNATRAEFGWINLVVMFGELCGVVWILMRGAQ
jgi:hypothetical protein